MTNDEFIRMEVKRSLQWLGKVTHVVLAGPYIVAEYNPRKTGPHLGPLILDQFLYSVFIRTGARTYQETSTSYESFDEALAGGIAWRAEGSNHRGNRYFMAAIKAIAGEGYAKDPLPEWVDSDE